MKPTQLTDAELSGFRRDGFLVCRNLLNPAEIDQVRAWTEEVAGRPLECGKIMVYGEDSLSVPGVRIVARIENFYPYHEGFAQLLDSDRIRGRASDLLAEDAVLFKDKINFKLPGGSGFTPHQDVQAGWERYGSIHLTAMITIDPCTLENGCLEMAAGHHARGQIGPSWAPLGQEVTDQMRFEPCLTQPGDVIFFDSFAPHRSGPNATKEPRRVLYITYGKASEGDQRLRYYEDKRRSYPPDFEREPDQKYVFRV